MVPSPRILIVRLSALGDVIHGLPVASALRERFPSAMLAWSVEGRAAELIEGHPDLDEVVHLPRRWWRSYSAIRSLRQQLHELQFDITVDLQCLTKSAIVAWLSGAPRRLGAGGSNGRELSKWFNNELISCDASHVVDHYLQILRPLGIYDPPVRFKLPERSCDSQFAEQALAQVSLLATQFAILNPGAGWPSKLWPAERYGDVAKHLLQTHGMQSLAVWGGEQERPLAESIVAASNGAAIIAPATTMRQLAAVTRRASLFVGSDTGPMHLAVAVDTPTISLHGTSRADWCGAYGAANIRLQEYYHAGTARERRAADNTAMRAISAEKVSTACDDLLSRQSTSKVS
ncbi:MAG: glycosyltransferase family 9 protein [Aeoliella sp.]